MEQIKKHMKRAKEIRYRLEKSPSIKLDAIDRGRVAERIGELVKEIADEHSMRTVDVVRKIWPAYDEARDLSSKLQRYAIINNLNNAALDRRTVYLTKRAAKYYKFIESLCEEYNKNLDEVLVRVFKDTDIDLSIRKMPDLERKGYVEFQRLLEAATRRVGEVVPIDSYYRTLGKYGVIRRVADYGVVLSKCEAEPMEGDPLYMLSVNARLPVVDCINDGFSAPSIWAGLAPSIPLYRIRIMEPIEAKLQFDPVTVHENITVLSSAVTVWVCDLYEVRLGIAPADGSARPAPYFECRFVTLIREAKNKRDLYSKNYKEIQPREWCAEYASICSMNHDGLFRYMNESEWRKGRLSGTSDRNGDIIDIGELDRDRWDRQSQFKAGHDSDQVFFASSNEETLYKYLVDMPIEYMDSLEYVDLKESVASSTAPGLFPTCTVGDYLVQQFGGVMDKLRREAQEHIVALQNLLSLQYKNAAQTIVSGMSAVLDSTHEFQNPLEPFDLKAWRSELNLKQGDAARLLGICRRTYVGYERGEKQVTRAIRLACEFCRQNIGFAKALASKFK